MKLMNSAFLCIVLLQTACASIGNSSLRNETVESINETLAVGHTMDQVRGALGDPFLSSRSSDGLRMWIYSYSEAEVSATTLIPVIGLFDSSTTSTGKTLQISFDENDLVADFTMTESDMGIDTSIFN